MARGRTRGGGSADDLRGGGGGGCGGALGSDTKLENVLGFSWGKASTRLFYLCTTGLHIQIQHMLYTETDSSNTASATMDGYLKFCESTMQAASTFKPASLLLLQELKLERSTTSTNLIDASTRCAQ
jgi:hypothetical protein